jgi:hypothetical protein
VENTSPAVPPQVSTDMPQVTVSVNWAKIEELEPRHTNQVMGQLGNPGPDGIPDGIYIGLGVITPPVLQAPTPEEARKLAASLQGTSVTVTPHGRFHMSRVFLDAVIKNLQATADQYDNVVAQAEAAKAERRGGK